MKWVNTFNRIVVVISCLVLIVALTALFLLPQTVLLSLGQWMLDWGIYIQDLDPWARFGIGIALALVVDVILVIFIVLQILRPRSRFLRVQKVAGGTANINTKSVIELLQYRLDPLPGVIKITPTIKAKGNRVTARVDAGVARGTNVPQVANQLINLIQTVLTEEMGLQIAGQPEVQVTVARQTGSRTETTLTPPPAIVVAPPEPFAEVAEDELPAPPPLETGDDEESGAA